VLVPSLVFTMWVNEDGNKITSPVFIGKNQDSEFQILYSFISGLNNSYFSLKKKILSLSLSALI
jgi:hypothetical protein